MKTFIALAQTALTILVVVGIASRIPQLRKPVFNGS